MPILNYTTSIDASKSANEVVGVLARHGASTVAGFYENGRPTGVAFTIATEFGPKDFRLPTNPEGVLAALKRDRTVQPRYETKEHAERVAWRILKDWIEAQVALIEAGISRLDEVMLPYMVMAPNGPTVSQIYRSGQGRLALEAAPVDDVIDAEIVVDGQR